MRLYIGLVCSELADDLVSKLVKILVLDREACCLGGKRSLLLNWWFLCVSGEDQDP